MKQRALWAIVAAACAAGGRAEPASRPGTEAWRALMASSRPAPGQVEAVLTGCGGRLEAVRALIAADAAYPPLRAGWLRRGLAVADGAETYDVAFDVRLPAGYTPERSWPVILAVHGQASTGRDVAELMAQLLGRRIDEYVLLAPTMPGPDHYSGRAYQEQSYLRPLAWARRNLNVDDDRVYVSGYSMGAHGTWHLATMFPRHFAAAVPMAGVPRFEGAPHTSFCYLENLSELAVWAIWGERDRAPAGLRGTVDDAREAAERLRKLRNRHFRGTELKGVGHAGCFPPRGELAKYLAARRRRALPEGFTHRFHLAHHHRGYYVEALRLAGEPLDLSRRLRVPLPPGSRGTQAEARAAIRDFLDRHLFEFRATLARAGNALAVRTRRVPAVRIYVLDGMFDLSRPVNLQLDGRTWTGRIAPSARCVLAHYAADRDAAALVVNEVEMDSAGKVAVRYP